MIAMPASSSLNAEAVVARQLEAYNARDIEAFMVNWADDARVFLFPETLLASGADQIRARHIERFKEPKLFGHLLSRMVVDDVVVDRERVTRSFPDGPGTVEVIAIYEVVGGKIVKAWFKQGQPVLDAKA